MEYLPDHEVTPAIIYCEVAAKLAKNSTCLKAQHGVVIVKNRVIIGEGWNTPVPDKPCNPCSRKSVKGLSIEDMCHAIHAEENAVVNSFKNIDSFEDLNGTRAYHAALNEDGIRRDNTPYCTKCSRLFRKLGISMVLIDEKGFALYEPDEFDIISYKNRKKALDDVANFMTIIA